MTLQQMYYFLEVVKTRHFTKAAQNLYVSQSALSHSIQSMEREVGAPLFIREKRGRNVELTIYGRTLLPYCEKAVAAVQDGLDTVEKLRNPSSGVVSVIYSYINCESLVPSIFNAFYEKNDFHDITVQFTVNHERHNVEKEILAGNADLGFTSTSDYEGLNSRKIAVQELAVMMSVRHPLAGKDKVTLEELQEDTLLSYYPASNLYNWVQEMYQQSGVKASMDEDYRDWSSWMSYVALNQGIAIAPPLPVNRELISVVPLDHPMKERPLYIFWSEQQPLSPAVAYVRDYCIRWSEEKFGKL